MLLPIVAAPFEKERLDTKTRALEPVYFENSWATGLKQLLDLLSVAHCPQASSGGAGIALRSFMPPDVTSNQPEMLYANCFRVLQVPDAILRFTSMKPLEGDRFYQVQRQWAFRRVDPQSFLAFHPPPDAIQAELDIQNAGGAAWAHFVEIDGILTRNLVPELVRKSLEVECVRRGLQFCEDRHVLYFSEGLLPSNRLYFNKPDGRRPFVSVVGRRTYRRSHQRLPYRYQLVPVFSVEHVPACGLAAFVRVRLRLTDDNGTLLKGRTAVSRRKHLCRDWWNDEWFHRTLAMMQFLSDEGMVVIGSPSPHKIILNLAPDQWEVPIRVEEASIQNKRAKRNEALIYGSDDESESDDE